MTLLSKCFADFDGHLKPMNTRMFVQTNFSLVSMLKSRSGHVTNEMNHL